MTINQNTCQSDSTQRRIIEPLVEFGGTRLLPFVLTAEYFNILAERLPGLVEAICRNEHFQWRSEDKVFRMNSTGSYRVARLTLDKHWISFKLHELRNLLYIFYMITNQSLMYAVIGRCSSLCKHCNGLWQLCRTAPTASKSIIYSQLFDELKSPV